MATSRRGRAALLIAALALAGSGCGTSSAIPDSKIVAALDLQRTSHGYQMGDDPFCAVIELLNDSGEVKAASDQGGRDFVIASPDGTVGVLAEPPFAPKCTKQAKDALKKLAREQG